MPPTPSDAEIESGQAVYTRRLLAKYDLLVLGISNRWIWRCPTKRILALYDQHITGNHLDVGVGTGWFLDHCRFPTASPRVALMDLNPNTLEYASERIARYSPETYQQNILASIEPNESADPIAPFDSIGTNYLFHCLPGTITDKAVALDHLAPLMRPGTVVFGSTLLSSGTGVRRNRAAKRLMAYYNGKGIFANTEDDLEGLKAALDQRFDQTSIEIVGCAALFSGTCRR